MTPQIVRRGHAAAALRLQLENPQDASVAAGDLDALLARADDAPGAFAVSPPTRVENSLSVCPPSSHTAHGHGISPRT